MHPVFNHSIYFCFGYFITCIEGINTPPHFTNNKKLFFDSLILRYSIE